MTTGAAGNAWTRTHLSVPGAALAIVMAMPGCSGKLILGQEGNDRAVDGPTEDTAATDASSDAIVDADVHESARTGAWCPCEPGTLERADGAGCRPPTPPKPRSNDPECNHWDESEPGDCGIPSDLLGVFTCCHGEVCRGRCLHLIDEPAASCICTYSGDTCTELEVCCNTPIQPGCVEAGTCEPTSPGPY